MNEPRYRELKEKMAALKNLYASRHYSQCAKFGELLLNEIHDHTHPLHLAHLNFYTALSHDTLAREATLKNRWKELSLAELHYNAAIVALSPLQSPSQSDPCSPNSSTITSPPSPYSYRRSSTSSDKSAASSATSTGDSSSPAPPPTLRHTRNDSVVQPPSPATKAPPTDPAPRPQTPQQFYFTANISSFARMLAAHAADVRDQKQRTSVPTVRFSVPSPRPSLVKAKGPGSRDCGEKGLSDEEDGDREARRERRRNVVFRARFDATRTRELCGEALAELSE